MRGHRAAAPRLPRVRARTTAIGAFVVLAAMVPAAVSASATQKADVALPYVCRLPSGELPATVRVTADFPATARAGEAFTPTGVTTSVELPAEAVADLARGRASGVRAVTRLGIGIAQGESAAEATWRGTARPAALPASGPLTLTATGDVASVTANADGALAFSAGALDLDLALDTPDGTAADPAALTIGCSLAEDAPKRGLLATVPIEPDPAPSSTGPAAPAPSVPAPDTGTPGTPGASGTPGSPDGRDGRGSRGKAPTVTERAPRGAAARRPDAPPCRYDERHPSTSASLNAYVTGYTNVRKLAGASLIPLSCALIEQGPTDIELFPDYSGGYLTQRSQGTLWYRDKPQTPPFQATFLTFGFVPTKATMVLEQTGPMTMDGKGETSFVTLFTKMETRVRVPLVLRVTALEVNGTPLDVGAGCRTRGPLRSEEPEPAKFPGDHLVLTGRSSHQPPALPVGYLLSSGGPLTGEVTIPAFTHCGGKGENVDRLLTASVSGPGNYVKQMQGQTCAVQVFNPDQCTKDLQPLVIPVPER
ncbi:DUF6801 domain-containing protein [Streptomyces sp. WELS2]|uniref:DUF6801 domain-containing protein n=1 Tax=Streptomyces sp. WELS2 TaxID=2749435 RepID=UPI0015F088E0|nr:DUF6801 domain-containing protein [Streptomyces sp. WELS2]